MSQRDTTHPVTWTLSGFGDEIGPEPEVQFAVLQALGARHVEMRGAWGTNVVDLSDEQVETFAGLLASALCVTKTRPAEVVAHSVPWSALFRAIHETAPPARSDP